MTYLFKSDEKGINVCPWCRDGESSEYVPEDDDDAQMVLCAAHAAEALGTSENMLIRSNDQASMDWW